MGYLYGESIILRDYREEDIKEVYSWANDNEIGSTLGRFFIKANTIENLKDYYNHVQKNNGISMYYFTIVEKETNNYVGCIDLRDLHPINKNCSFGLVIRKEYWNKGYGRETLSLIFDFAFNQINLNKINLNVFEDNIRGIKLYEKCGFQTEGIVRDALYKDGKYVSSILMGITKKDYLEMIKK